MTISYLPEESSKSW